MDPSYGGGYGQGGYGQGGYGGQQGYQGQATQYAQRGMAAAGGYASQGVDAAQEGLMGGLHAFNAKVQKGPAGVTLLAFGGGAALTFIGIWTFFTIVSIGITDWLINCFQILFGIFMMLIEAQGDWLDRLSPKAVEFQAKLGEYAKFLTLLLGRGIFYIFLGSLTMTTGLSEPLDVMETLIGVYVMFIGIICIGMHTNPQAVQSASAGLASRYPGGGKGGDYGPPADGY
jgi:hypothetical protein